MVSEPMESEQNGVRAHVNSKVETASPEGSEEGRTHDAASRRTASPRQYQLSYSGPHSDGLMARLLCREREMGDCWGSSHTNVLATGRLTLVTLGVMVSVLCCSSYTSAIASGARTGWPSVSNL